MASQVPDQLTLRHHRDLIGRERRPLTRHILLGALAVICVLGLLNLFGQSPEVSTAEGAAASLEVSSPSRLRGGLYYQSRFAIEARRELENATLVLDPGWLEGITLNTLEPSPIGEASRDGKIALELGHIPAGGRHLFFLQFQVNPTNVGRRSQDVELHDGETMLLRVHRTVTVFP